MYYWLKSRSTVCPITSVAFGEYCIPNCCLSKMCTNCHRCQIKHFRQELVIHLKMLITLKLFLWFQQLTIKSCPWLYYCGWCTTSGFLSDLHITCYSWRVQRPRQPFVQLYLGFPVARSLTLYRHNPPSSSAVSTLLLDCWINIKLLWRAYAYWKAVKSCNVLRCNRLTLPFESTPLAIAEFHAFCQLS